MRSTSRRPDPTDVIAWVIVGGILVAFGVSLVHSVVELVRAAIDRPLLLAGCMAVSAIGVFTVRAGWRAVAGGADQRPVEVVVASPEPPARSAAPRERLESAHAGRLLDELTSLDAAAAGTALRELSADPYLLDGLFHHARRGALTEQLRLFAAAAVLPGAPPLACALASLDRNGYVRERAVHAMGRQPLPEFVPFLVERAVDVVEPVRNAALSVLTALLAASPHARGASLTSAAARVGRRRHAPAVLALISISGR